MPTSPTPDAHSEEVDDLVGRVPAWVLRGGSGTLLLVLLGLLAGAWLLEYPDVISSPVAMTTVSPPVPVVARQSGRLRELAVSDGDEVEPGAWLAVLENPARTEDVRALGELLRRLEPRLGELGVLDPELEALPPQVQLGELQVEYAAFLTAWRDAVAAERDPYYDTSEHQVGEQLDSSEALTGSLRQQQQGLRADLEQAERDARAARRLLDQGVLSAAEHAEAEAEVRERRRALEAAEVERLGREVGRVELQRGRLDLEHERRDRLRERHRQLQDAHATLARAYEAWRRDYVLVSPIPGRVAFHRIWNVNQWVAADEEVMTVIPSLDGIVGRVELGQHSSGKVEVGQRVVIKLDGYPYREFGVVEGRVDSVPSIAREGVYLVTVRLPEGLRTSHGHELTLRHDMRGTAEIVTADLRLLERMFFQLSSLMEGR